jgi:hypothetical protein
MWDAVAASGLSVHKPDYNMEKRVGGEHRIDRKIAGATWQIPRRRGGWDERRQIAGIGRYRAVRFQRSPDGQEVSYFWAKFCW